MNRLLHETWSYFHDSNFSSASVCLEQLFQQRPPENHDAHKLFSELTSVEQAAFRAELEPFLSGIRNGDLYPALSSLSKTLKTITDDILLLCEPSKTVSPLDDAIRAKDIALIRSALSRRDLEEAEARAKMAVLCFPDSDEVSSLDSEVSEEVRKDAQIKHCLVEAEEHLRKHEWKTAIDLFNSAHQLDPGRHAIRERIGEAYLSWAEELQHKDLGVALKLAESAVTLIPDNAWAREFRAKLIESYRSHAVATAMANANEHEAKGAFSMAEDVIRAAIHEFPDQPTLLLYLKELDKARRSRQYEQELRNIQDDVLNLTSGRKYEDAESALTRFLKRFPESATGLTLLEGVQRDHQQYDNAQIVDKALQDIATLAQGDLKALKHAIETLNRALQRTGAEPRLSKAIQELERRRLESEHRLEELLECAYDDILHARFKTANESLQSAAVIDPEDPRIEEVRRELRRKRTATRRSAFSAFAAAAQRVVTKVWVKHRWIAAICIVAVVIALAGIASYQYVQNGPKVAQLAIDSLPAGARVIIDGGERGVTPYTASWELHGGETRQVTVRLELQDYEAFENVVTLSADHPAPLFHQLKLANVAGVLGRLYQLAQSALNSGALISPQDGSVISYLNQMKTIDPGEKYLRTERANLRLESIKKYRDGISRLKPPERGGEVELTSLRKFVEFFDPDDAAINGRIEELEMRKSQQKQEIEQSIVKGVLLPPSSPNALDALQKFEAMFPGESNWVKEKRENARRKVVSTANATCASQPVDDCHQYVISALKFFPHDAELENTTRLSRGGDVAALGPEAQRLGEQMESAVRARRYVFPQNSSAAYFANQLRQSAPGYSRALDVMKIAREETDKEVEQLTGTTQETRALQSLSEGQAVLEDFRRAQNLLSAASRFWGDDAKSKRQTSELRVRIPDIEELTQKRDFSVIHDHLMGDCRGLLTISAYGVRYSPSGNDGFDRPMGDIRFPVDVRADQLELKTIDNKSWKLKLDQTMSGNTGSITIARNAIMQMKETRNRIENRQKDPSAREGR